ncbi:Not1 N-terminal domain, CCR4-Not complex component-domain-containing protein [Gamsiella multidivaricata]|uniref:Not1 N-terminal domain, CCR4-Not complex component-domain-containing protein n=1 Tax=Gamsiella multidivaricata TaxID=101098 RepID=UPI00221F7F8E|nr:Not1 N-terminal domain, CCR4-Not complex component-domain-containing protein [Gamsiella multidivaricata]KAI7832618.1 Not1 N-terminal domain, CCR4-Not complex component-domain-containing protein [Gamsiella multidivaricata]
MATRKLQTEIDKVLKKVAEGVETFEETLDKIEKSTHANQKEKYEADLKKEIKKLQRLRDQIKTWISSSDIKDKRALMDNRKLIEQQMEKFKAIEKEMKTKAYSREGLIMSGRMDPKEKEKAETCSWVAERVEALSIQIEALEAEVEILHAGTKKGKNNPAKERISELEEKIERHKWHQGRLELILRLLENGQIDAERVLAIQEDVNYYVDENSDPDFEEYEELYADLNLEEEEDFFTVGMEDHSGAQDQDDYESTPKKTFKELEPEPSPTLIPTPTPTPPKAAAKTLPTRKPSLPEPKEMKPVPAASPAATKLTPASTAQSRQPTKPRTGSYATAVAANLPTEPARAPASSASPSVVAAVLTKESPKAASTSSKVELSSPRTAAQTTVAPSSLARIQPSSAAKPSDPASTASRATADLSPALQSSGPSPSQANTEVYGAEGGNACSAKHIEASGEIRLPAALADLAHSFEASKERAMLKEVGLFVHRMLEASYLFIPDAADTERPKFYTPKNPYPTPSYYPQTPPPGLFENPAIFEKFDIDTLFFIFYYQQGTYQQYLAARELKKQSWRFHKQYLTWFQRHEEPKAITDDYEQGTYIYFDYEGAWCQRKKTDFRFEYKFLEDSELV